MNKDRPGENNAKNNIEYTLDGVIDFTYQRHKDLDASYKVFKEQFVVCWAGNPKVVKENTYYSRVDIELINEQVRLFYSALDEVSITYSEDYFKIIEYVHLGLNKKYKYYPLEEVVITFEENGSYKIDTELIFKPPQFNKKTLYHIFNSNNALIEKLKKGIPLEPSEQKDLKNLPANYLICYLNDFSEAKDKLYDARLLLKQVDESLFQSYKETVRILRKMKYN